MKNLVMVVCDFHTAVRIQPENLQNRYSLILALLDAELEASEGNTNFTVFVETISLNIRIIGRLL